MQVGKISRVHSPTNVLLLTH